jgi:hypothetical protein
MLIDKAVDAEDQAQELEELFLKAQCRGSRCSIDMFNGNRRLFLRMLELRLLDLKVMQSTSGPLLNGRWSIIHRHSYTFMAL